MASQSFNIEKFRARVTPPLKSNKFLLTLKQVPPAMTVSSNATSNAQTSGLSATWTTVFKDLSFYAEIVDLPGVELMTIPIRRYGYGPVELKPYEPRYGGCRVIFRGDQDGRVFEFMRAWQAVAVNYQFGYADNIISQTGWDSRESVIGPGVSRFTPYEVGYKGDYAVGVAIRMFGDDGHAAHEIVLSDAYPVDVGSIPLSWVESKAYAQLPVTLMYSRYAFQHLNP